MIRLYIFWQHYSTVVSPAASWQKVVSFACVKHGLKDMHVG